MLLLGTAMTINAGLLFHCNSTGLAITGFREKNVAYWALCKLLMPIDLTRQILNQDLVSNKQIIPSLIQRLLSEYKIYAVCILNIPQVRT